MMIMYEISLRSHVEPARETSKTYIGSGGIIRQAHTHALTHAQTLTELELLELPTYIKNCEPFVFLPRFAMDSRKGRSCFFSKLSSAKII